MHSGRDKIRQEFFHSAAKIYGHYAVQPYEKEDDLTQTEHLATVSRQDGLARNGVTGPDKSCFEGL